MFDDVIGQESVITILKSIIRLERYSSSYLFSGPTGTGKTTLGRIFSMAMLCSNPKDGNPCQNCESCQLFLKGQNYAFNELDAATYSGKEDMVKLRDDAAFLPSSKRKIILLDECQDISRQGQDALLKQIEDCPEHLVYIFCTTDPDKMNDTLRERCMWFQIVALDSESIVKRLTQICEYENISYDVEALRTIAERSAGHVRNAITMLESVMYLGSVNQSNLNIVSKDYDDQIFAIISNLGFDLNKSLEAYKVISSWVSPTDLYNNLINALNDACKISFGIKGFSPKRERALIQLVDLYGSSLFDLLNYFITRDKFIDRIGIQSDLIILHHKFSTRSFSSRLSIPISDNRQPAQISPQMPQNFTSENSEQRISYEKLSKLSVKDRSRILREQRLVQKTEQKVDHQKIPSRWPLPKEDRPGESSFDDEVLSPQEFSKQLVGGRGSGS